MSNLEQKLSQKRNLEAKWASELLANGSVTIEMVKIQKQKTKHIVFVVLLKFFRLV